LVKKKKQISEDDLIDLKLKRKEIRHIINQLEIYGAPIFHKICDDVVEKENIQICRILERSIVSYPKKYLISPSIKALEKMKHV